MTSTDGTTAIQVSPIPTEPEMNSFRQMLDRALNAIVQASELARVVENLKLEVAQFSADIESQRRRNQELDEMLSHVRAQRDKAEAELSHTQSKLAETERERDGSFQHAADMEGDVRRLKAELEQVRREADSNLGEYIKAQHEADEAKAKLADIQEFAQRLFPPKPSEPVPYPQPQPYAPDGTHDTTSPTVAQPDRPLTVSDIQEVKPEDAHAEQAQAEPKRIYQFEHGFDWAKPTYYDAGRGQNYNEV